MNKKTEKLYLNGVNVRDSVKKIIKLKITYHIMRHSYVPYGITLLFLLFQGFYSQASEYNQNTQEPPVIQPVQDLSTLLKVLETEKKRYGNKPHTDVAKALENIGHAYIKKNDYPKGLSYYKKALKVLKVVYGNRSHIDVARAYKNLGFAYGRQSGYQLSYYQKALKMYKGLYKDQAHIDVARLLADISKVYNDKRSPTKALSYAIDALAMFEALHGDEPNLDIAVALFNVGIYYRAISDLDNALLYLQQSLQMYTALAEDGLYKSLANVLSQIGGIHVDQHNFRKGIMYFQQALDVYKSRDDGRVYWNQVQAVQSIGAAYVKLKEFSQAIPHLKEALNIYEASFKYQANSAILTCLSDLGYAYKETGNFPESLSCYKQASKMCLVLSHTSGSLLEKIADIYGHMHNYSSQLSCLRSAKGTYQALGQEKAKQMSYGSTTYYFQTDGNIARVQHNMGMTYASLGDLQKSLKHFKSASNDYKTVYKQNKDYKGLLIGQIQALNMMGTVYESLGEYKKAAKYYKDGFRVACLLKDPNPLTDAHHHLGCFYHSVLRNTEREAVKHRYVRRAQVAFERAIQASSKPRVDLWASYANFLIDTAQLKQAYGYLMQAIDSEDRVCSLPYTWGQCTTAPPILQKQLQQGQIVTVRAIDCAFYLLLKNYDDFVHAGIVMKKPREAYLTAFKQSVKANVEGLEETQQNEMAKLLVDSL